MNECKNNKHRFGGGRGVFGVSEQGEDREETPPNHALNGITPRLFITGSTLETNSAIHVLPKPGWPAHASIVCEKAVMQSAKVSFHY